MGAGIVGAAYIGAVEAGKGMKKRLEIGFVKHCVVSHRLLLCIVCGRRIAPFRFYGLGYGLDLDGL